MFLTPIVGLTLFFYLSILVPLYNIYEKCLPNSPTSRWLAYFFCLNAISIPLLIIPYIPLRYEILLLTATLLAYDDARGAHSFSIYYIAPRINRAQNEFQNFLGNLSPLPPPSPLVTETVRYPSPVPD